ncbi:MAG: signal recognition particle-docking protein FtsY [Candidatus Melainabacteria bacterium]|nr:MAG: signal recognition particle-docking protein FtsY [Candidatus Melainabacteria bacterium]
MAEEEKSKSGFWGSTLGRLKSALAKTKEAVVDSVLDRGEKQQTDTGSSAPRPITSTDPIQASQYSGQDSPASSVVVTTNAVAPPRQPVPIDEDYLEDLEEKLIRADLGLATVELLTSDLRKQAKANHWNSADVETFLKAEFSKMLSSAPSSRLNIAPSALTIVLIVGVNGTGKTTSIGKLCHRLKTQGKKVLMAAGDTFRAAAETQLEIWATRAEVDIVRLPDGSDPGAVVYQAIKKAQTENYDVLVIDTAGRLHNKTNLMAELKKVRAVIDKNAADATIESLLVLDASIGQNGLQQAKVFTEVCGLTGVIVTKLDGTAKGGVVFTIANELKIPVKLIGLGEKIDDLRDFEPELFVEALF